MSSNLPNLREVRRIPQIGSELVRSVGGPEPPPAADIKWGPPVGTGPFTGGVCAYTRRLRQT